MKNKYVVRAVGHPVRGEFTVNGMYYTPNGWKEKRSDAEIMDEDEAKACISFLKLRVSGLKGMDFVLVKYNHRVIE